MRFSTSQKYGKNSKTEKISTEVAVSQLQGQDWKKCDDKPYKTDFQVLIMMVDLSDCPSTWRQISAVFEKH